MFEDEVKLKENSKSKKNLDVPLPATLLPMTRVVRENVSTILVNDGDQ